jgi:hypothetical protein
MNPVQPPSGAKVERGKKTITQRRNDAKEKQDRGDLNSLRLCVSLPSLRTIGYLVRHFSAPNLSALFSSIRDPRRNVVQIDGLALSFICVHLWLTLFFSPGSSFRHAQSDRL